MPMSVSPIIIYDFLISLTPTEWMEYIRFSLNPYSVIFNYKINVYIVHEYVQAIFFSLWSYYMIIIKCSHILHNFPFVRLVAAIINNCVPNCLISISVGYLRLKTVDMSFPLSHVANIEFVQSTYSVNYKSLSNEWIETNSCCF